MAEEKKPVPIAEIVTTIIIVIILIVFAVPRFVNWTDESVIGNEASKLYYNLETAKNTAVENKHRVWVYFLGTSKYRIFEDTNGNNVQDGGEPVRNIEMDPSVQFGLNLEPPIQNVWGTASISSPIEFTGGKREIYFEPSGKANSTGAIYLIAKADMGSSNADVRALKIIGANGKISVLKLSPDDSPPWK